MVRQFRLPLLLGTLQITALGCGGEASQRANPQAVTIVDSPATNTAAAGTSTTTSGGVTPGGDENDPMTYVNRLSDASMRPAAVERIIQLFNNADKNARNDPQVQRILDAAVQPLSQHCTAKDFDARTQSKVVSFLADARDKRGLPCLSKTLEEYEPDVTESDMRTAARGVAAMKAQDAAAPLFSAFKKVHVSKPKAAPIYRDLNEAVVEMSDPSWEDQCIATTGKPIDDKKDLAGYNDESYWQLTCAQVLGRLKSEKAVPNLIKIMLSPMKVQVQSTAINALIRIGKPVIAPTVALLEGKNAEMVEYAKAEALKSGAAADGNISEATRREAAKAYFLPAAVILGSIGREEAAAPMIAQIGKTDPVGKALLARELLKLPISESSLKVVREVYEKTDLTATIPPGMNARGAVLEQMGYVFDSRLVPWLVKETLRRRGSDEDLEEARGNAFVLALKLARHDQVNDIDKLGNLRAFGGDTIANGYKNEAALAKALLEECTDKLDCYVNKLLDPSVHVGDKQFVGIKAAYMVGVLGTEAIKPKLLDLLPQITGDAARFVVVQSIDHFSPRGDATAATRMLGMLAEAEKQKNSRLVAGYSYFRQFGHRLLARE